MSEVDEITAYGPIIGANIMKFTYRGIKDIDTIKEMGNEINTLGQKWSGRITATTYLQFQKELKELLDRHQKILVEKEPCEELIFSFGFIKRKLTKGSGIFEKIKALFGGDDEREV